MLLQVLLSHLFKDTLIYPKLLLIQMSVHMGLLHIVFKLFLELSCNLDLVLEYLFLLLHLLV